HPFGVCLILSGAVERTEVPPRLVTMGGLYPSSPFLFCNLLDTTRTLLKPPYIGGGLSRRGAVSSGAILGDYWRVQSQRQFHSSFHTGSGPTDRLDPGGTHGPR